MQIKDVILGAVILYVCVTLNTLIFSNNNINMAESVWGQLAKAQDDNETIEEAIVRLITAHEADAGAHTGSGESLETHKAQDIIDHKAGSVLVDKETMTEIVAKDNLKTLTGWNTTGNIDETDWPGCKFYIEWGAVTESSMFVQSVMPASFFNTGFDMVFQTSMYFDLSGSAYEAWLGIAIDDILPNDGFGFIFEDGVTKAVFAIGSTRTFSSAITNDETAEHVYRAQYNALAEEAEFYIDGDLKATISKPTGTGNLDVGGSIGIKITEEEDGNMVVGPVTMSRAI